jgi:hypothetical protein
MFLLLTASILIIARSDKQADRIYSVEFNLSGPAAATKSRPGGATHFDDVRWFRRCATASIHRRCYLS